MTPIAARAAVGAAGAVVLCASVLRPCIEWLGTSHRTATYPEMSAAPDSVAVGA